MDARARYDDLEDALQAALDGRQARMWTSVPCKIIKVHDDGNTVNLQPLVKAVIRLPDGTQKEVDLPEIHDVRVHHPRGGGGDGHAMTMPHAVDDEVTLFLNARGLDNWQEQGGQQPQPHARMHDLSDGFALVGNPSKPNLVKGVSKTSAQVRTLDRKSVVDVSGTGVINQRGEDSLTQVADNGVVNRKADTTTAWLDGRLDERSSKIMMNCG